MEIKLPKSGTEIKFCDSFLWGHQSDIDERTGEGGIAKRIAVTMTVIIEKFGDQNSVTEEELRKLDYHVDFVFLAQKVGEYLNSKKKA